MWTASYFVFFLLVPLFTRHTDGMPWQENITESNVEDERINYRLPANIIPVHYNLKLVPDILRPSPMFNGSVTISFQVLNATNSIVFHARDLTIDHEATFVTTETGFSIRLPNNHSFNKQTDMSSVYFENELVPGNYSLHLKFTGILSSKGFGFIRSSYVDDSGNKIWLAAAKFEPVFARQSFPCMDEPALKATFSIAIKHHSNYTALSNMPVLEQSAIDPEDGKIWTQFKTTPRISTYHVSYVISDYQNISSPDGTINIWCKKSSLSQAKLTYEVARKAAAEMQQLLNSSMRAPKLDHVAIPNMRPDGEENWGIVLYKENIMLFNELLQPEEEMSTTVMPVVHETVHQWFGNIVTPVWWTHLWLKESLTSYFQHYVTDKIYKDWAVMDMFVPDVLHMALFLDTRRTYSLDEEANSPLEIISKAMRGIQYDKGAVIVRMLVHCITKEVFLKGLNNYIQKHEYDAASPDNLWDSLQNSFDESSISPKFNIKKIMDPWFKQTGFPVIEVEVNHENGTVMAVQRHFSSSCLRTTELIAHEECNKKWWIPLSYTTTSHLNFSSTAPISWLNPMEERVFVANINVQDWIILNIQQTGFYRVNYDDATWKMISEYLNTENYGNIHQLNRGQILNDAFHLMLAQQLDPIRFMEITEYLSRETDVVPWSVAMRIFGSLRRVNLTTIKYMEPYIWSLMDHYIENVGIEKTSADNHAVKVLKYSMRYILCEYRHPKCMKLARDNLHTLLEDPFSDKIPPYTLDWVLEYGLQYANESTWYQATEMLETYHESLTTYLGCVANKTIAHIYLNLSLEGSSPVLSEKRIISTIKSILSCRPENIDVILDFVVEKWPKILSRVDHPALVIRYLQSYMSAKNFKLLPDQTKEKISEFLRSIEREKSITSIESKNEKPFVQKIREWLKNRYSNTHETHYIHTPDNKNESFPVVVSN